MTTPPRARAGERLLPILGGALMGAAFQPWGLWFLAFVGLVPLLIALDKAAAAPARALRAGFRTGYLFGLAYFAVMIYWILFLTSNEVPNRIVMVPLFLMMAGYLALYPALFGLAFVACVRRTRIPAAFLAPPLWVASEWLRGAGEMGFPWGNAGYSLAASLPLLQTAAWVGVPGMSLIVVAVNAAARRALRADASPRARFAPLAVALVALAALFAAGSVRLAANPPAAERSLRVAVFQPNISQGIKWDWQYKDKSLDAIARLAQQLSPGTIDLAVWPETAIPAYLHQEKSYFDLVQNIVKSARAPTLLGFPDTQLVGSDRVYYNAAMYLLADGSSGGEYRKMHLVPFGEMLPFQSILPALRNVDFGEADFTPGTEKTLFDAAGHQFGVSICFEAIFPSMTRDLVRRGAEILVNITNDAWYGRTTAAWQHARMALVRSIEDGVCQLRAANTGISFVSDPYGRTLAETEIFVEEVLVAEIDPRRVPTFYVQAGDICLMLALAVSGAALVMAIVARREPSSPR
jgi:apolipoprotein N-acyltransferase